MSSLPVSVHVWSDRRSTHNIPGRSFLEMHLESDGSSAGRAERIETPCLGSPCPRHCLVLARLALPWLALPCLGSPRLALARLALPLLALSSPLCFELKVGNTDCPLQVCQLSRSSAESTHFRFLRRDVALFVSTRPWDSF